MFRKGTKITCESGHLICEVARDVNVGEPIADDQFANWTIAPPTPATPFDDIPKCSVCGARWFIVGESLPPSVWFHFEDGYHAPATGHIKLGGGTLSQPTRLHID